MLIVIDNETVLNVKKVISMLIKYTPEISKTKISGFFGFGSEYKETKTDCWTLEFDYVSDVDGKSYKYSTSGYSHSLVKARAKEVITQLKQYDSTLVNKAFEDAFLKDS